MNADFHYYATYCASIIAGFSHLEAEKIAYSANFVDTCTTTILKKCGAPLSAATTQSQLELADFGDDLISLQEITRIWASFHFLPGDLYAPIKYGGRNYKNKYRLICRPNGALVMDTVNLAKGSSLEAFGIAMHILADTWAHQNFAGTPSSVINNTDNHFFEVIDGKEYPIYFHHRPGKEDDIKNRIYLNSIYQQSESSIMNLGHGRAGHLPDLAFITYRYMPAWGKYQQITKDNPSDFYHAFTQMVYALKYLKGTNHKFELNEYDSLNKYKNRVKKILTTRKLNLTNEWKIFAKELSKHQLKNFDVKAYVDEYVMSKNKNKTPFASFIHHALKQKSMVTNRIYRSKNKLAGYSVKYNGKGIGGLKDYWELISHEIRGKKDE